MRSSLSEDDSNALLTRSSQRRDARAPRKAFRDWQVVLLRFSEKCF